MKPFRKLLLLCFVVLFSGFVSVILYLFLSPERPRPLYSQGFIQLSDEFNINFTEIGIAVSSPHTTFYSPQGSEIEPPFAAEDFINLPLGFSVNKSTENYLLINAKYIYSTIETPFKMIWQSDEEIIKDIIEIGDSLLLILKEQDNFLVPKIFDLTSNELTNLQGLYGSYFLDAAISESTGSFSILAFSDDGLFPSARIFHYNSKAALFSSLTLKDSLYFNIYKMQSSFVLVGADRVICYNTSGSENWVIEVSNAYRHYKVSSGNYVFLYFENSPTNFSNTLRIGKDASKEWFELPYGLSSLQSYSEGLIGVLNHREIVVFNTSGNLTARFEPGIDIDRMYYDSELPDYIFLLDRFRRLFAHTIFEPAD